MAILVVHNKTGENQIDEEQRGKAPRGEKRVSIDMLLERNDLWQASQCKANSTGGYRTGFSELDEQLPDRGWPTSGVCEIFSFGFGQGELCFIYPLLREIVPKHVNSQHRDERSQHNRSQSDRIQNDSFVLLIAPPLIPYAPTLEQEGIDSKRLLWLKSQERKEQLWALEQALSSGACPLVVAWLTHLSVAEARRLQLASEKGNSLAIFYLPHKQSYAAHPVVLKLSLSTHKASANDAISNLGLQRISLLKRRGAWARSSVDIKLLPERLLASFNLAMGVPVSLSSQHDVDRSDSSQIYLYRRPPKVQPQLNRPMSPLICCG